MSGSKDLAASLPYWRNEKRSSEKRKKESLEKLNKFLPKGKFNKFVENDKKDCFASDLFDPDQKVSEKYLRLSKKLEMNKRSLNFCEKNIPFFKDSNKLRSSEKCWVGEQSQVLGKIVTENFDCKKFTEKFNDFL